tara:strand:- start:186 stop:2270 length:2085 start_codon:yes stop_codon:yes gene_type:complete
MEKEKLQKELVDKALIEIEKKNIDRLKLVVEDMMTNFKNSAITYLFKANIHILEKDYEETVSSFKKCLKIAPNYGEAHRQYAEFLRISNDIKNSIIHAKKSIELNPNHVAANDTLGNSLMADNNVKEAIAVYKRGLEINPKQIEILNNLGNAYRRNGDLKNSILCFKECIKIDPEKPIFYTNLALTLFELENYIEALKLARKANELQKDNPHVYAVSGHILTKLYKFIDAEKSYAHAIKLDDRYSMAYNGLANTQKLLGKLDECLNSLLKAYEFSNQRELDYSNILMVKNYLLNNNYKNVLKEAKTYEKLNFNKKELQKTFKNLPKKNRKLKIGFMSGDFYEHPVGYFIPNTLTNLSKDNFKLYGYYNNQINDNQTLVVKDSFDIFKNINSFSDEQKFDLIQEDGIDILFDLSGHTARNSLTVFRKRAAPIQISWLGYCFTTGLSSMDYIICDDFVLPKKDEKWFTEKPIRMSNSYYCFSLPKNRLIKIEKRQENIDNFVFGCFSNAPKITEDVMSLWSEILKKTENSLLLLKAKTFSDEQGFRRILDYFEMNKISKDRIIFEGNSIREDYLKSYNKIDMILDTFPYPGGTTTCEALLMGVPVVSLEGNNFLSNNGKTILKNSSLDEFIAKSKKEYVEIASSFCKKENQSNTKIKEDIRKRFLDSPLLNGKLFAKELEKKLLAVWQIWEDEHNK